MGVAKNRRISEVITPNPQETVEVTEENFGDQESSPGFDPQKILETHCDHFLDGQHPFVIGELKRAHTAAIQAAKREGHKEAYTDILNTHLDFKSTRDYMDLEKILRMRLEITNAKLEEETTS